MLKREKRPIHHALLKYGHENFTLEILECWSGSPQGGEPT
jgi:hypothetical protein